MFLEEALPQALRDAAQANRDLRRALPRDTFEYMGMMHARDAGEGECEGEGDKASRLRVMLLLRPAVVGHGACAQWNSWGAWSGNPGSPACHPSDPCLPRCHPPALSPAAAADEEEEDVRRADFTRVCAELVETVMHHMPLVGGWRADKLGG